MPPSTGIEVRSRTMRRQTEVERHVRHLLRLAVAAQRHPTPGVDRLRLVGSIAAVMPVSIGPGQMQLTVIPCRPSSTAMLLVSPTTPALVAA